MKKKMLLYFSVALILIYLTGCGVNSSNANGEDLNFRIDSAKSQEQDSETVLNNKDNTEPNKTLITGSETSPAKEHAVPQMTEEDKITPTPEPTPAFTVTPAPISDEEEIIIVAISAGETHAAAIDNKGVLYTWGGNQYGQLGDGTTTDRSVPKPVPGITNAKSVVCGFRSTFVLCEDGLVYSFGDKGFIGRDYGENTLPVAIKELTDIIEIDSNSYDNIALKSDGTVYDWGWNSHEEIHDIPKKVKEVKDIVSVAVGNGYYLAVDKNGEVWVWGRNDIDIINIGSLQPYCRYPEKARNIHNVKSVCGTGSGIIGLHYDGNVTRWGKSDGSEVIFSSKDVMSVHAGNAHFLAVKKDGTVYSWGINKHGELGSRTLEEHLRTPDN
ncbi:MAG: hypothetical protein GX213_05125 [Clostridiaceae bacterium]|nr:hypothetical protein [Clostridiaceae bacterium]